MIVENFNITVPTTGSLLTLEDRNLVQTYRLDSSFDTTKDRVELHLYTLNGQLLFSDYDYRFYKIALNSSIENNQIDLVEIDPVKDAAAYGYATGDIRLSYSFIKPIGTDEFKEPQFFIKEISPDRTELLLDSTQNVNLKEIEEKLLPLIEDTTLLQSVVLNFKDGKFFQIINAKSIDTGLAVKLYTPLTNDLVVKEVLTINDLIGDTISYDVERQIVEIPDPVPSLKGPNFAIDLTDELSNPTEYLNSLQLLQAITSSVYEPYYFTNKLGIELSIDYSDYSNFINFSSAEERLRNFKYKLDQLSGYQVSRSLAESITPASQATSSMQRYDAIIEGVIKNFDHYDRHLYFESSSTSWPKSNSIKPYNNYPSSHPTASAFFTTQLTSASLFDERNENRLINTIPSFLKEDANNAPYNLFIDMIGQHFDNLWIYAKAAGDRYDADNRLDRGISKDLVGEALKNFGIKLYSSNSSFDNLFSMFVGEFYQTGSETVNTFISASNQPVGRLNYQREIYKRLYHNTPLLIKSKGTERGIKALFTSFGVPTNLLNIRYTGGVRKDTQPYYGPSKLYTSSLDRIRLDNTGSIVTGNTLSQYTSIIKPVEKYTQDLHGLEIGFSPSDYTNDYITSASLLPGSFNIDNYIGDPRIAYSSSYDLMDKVIYNSVSGSLSRYNVKDLVRLVKFYDNTLFKMVKDGLPARVNVSTGIIIKPSIINRSKVKQPQPLASWVYYSGSTNIGAITGSHGRATRSYNTAFSYLVRLPSGSFGLKQSLNEARFTGEFSGSNLVVTTGELNPTNPFKKDSIDSYSFRIRPLSGSSIPDSVFSLTIAVTDYPT